MSGGTGGLRLGATALSRLGRCFVLSLALEVANFGQIFSMSCSYIDTRTCILGYSLIKSRVIGCLYHFVRFHLQQVHRRQRCRLDHHCQISLPDNAKGASEEISKLFSEPDALYEILNSLGLTAKELESDTPDTKFCIHHTSS